MRNTADIFLRTCSIDTCMYQEILHRITDKNVRYNTASISGRRCKYVTKYVREVYVRAVHANFK